VAVVLKRRVAAEFYKVGIKDCFGETPKKTI